MTSALSIEGPIWLQGFQAGARLPSPAEANAK